MGTAHVRLAGMPNRKGKNSRSQAKKPCKCLVCARATREVFFGKKLLICRDEACDMRCDVCTERPNTTCGFIEMEGVAGEREEVLA